MATIRITLAHINPTVGDFAAGLAVGKDVPKMLVYELAQCINWRGDKPIIPEFHG
jgi:hypothetical protein